MRNRSLQRTFAVAVCITVFIVWHATNLHISGGKKQQQQDRSSILTAHRPCFDLPGSNDTLVVLRTGATELEDRAFIHLTTSLQCFPAYMIFSDLEEQYRGEHIIDALESVDPMIKSSSDDFKLYRRLQQGGRAALDVTELSGSADKLAAPSGHQEIPGWKLDKWKFLPMMARTYQDYPFKKWYVFMEGDTFLLWSMLLRYLAALDPTASIYAGSPVAINGVGFAHGGSGFIVSQSALRAVVNEYLSRKAEIETFTDSHWAGDCVLGRTFKESGVAFLSAWPLFQGDYPGLIPYAKADGRSVPSETAREWCYPTVSYHHMTPAMTEELWHFEQKWMEDHDARSDVLRHQDIFRALVMPRMMAPLESWDNMSDKKVAEVETLDACRALCEAEVDCKQYSYDQDRVCKTRVDPRLGQASSGISSGWIEQRIKDFEQNMPPCGSEGLEFAGVPFTLW